MISHFWNFCRACPALEADKLYSEYRSTYKWHEVTGNSNANNTSSNEVVVVKRPPKPISDEFNFTRKKKHPDLAYRSHEFFDPSLAPAFPTRGRSSASSQRDAVDSSSARERSTQRRHQRSEFREAQRRAQSEGPGIRNPMFRISNDGPELRPSLPSSRPASARRRAAHKSANDVVQDGTMQNSFPPPNTKWRQTNNNSRQQMKESVSMGQIDTTKDVSASRGYGEDDMVTSTKSMSASQNVASEVKEKRHHRRDYKSEYKQRFRPFSQYEYLGDGRFVTNANGNGPVTTASKIKQQLALQPKATSLHGEPWYREVVELRKQANDYKCRGWGTDLVPPHMSDLYHKQIELHEAAARRESLSALSLAISSPRGASESSTTIGKAVSSTGDRISPSKSASLGRPSRPRTAPPNRAYSKSSRSESAHPVSDIGAFYRKDVTDAVVSSKKQPSTTTTTTPSAGGRAKSPTKRVASRPPSASTASSSVAPSPAPVHEGSSKPGPPVQQQPQQTSQQQPQKRQRPTTLNTTSTPQPHSRPPSKTRSMRLQQQQQPSSSASTAEQEAASHVQKAKSTRIEALKSDNRDLQPKPGPSSSHNNDSGSLRSTASSGMPDFSSRRPFSRSSSKGGVGDRSGGGPTSTTSSRPPSAFENHIDYFREPVVKSPPEPTRVKSPEAVVRSPDPINWTVPLDTGKTFSVTQSIKDGESSRHSPLSDQSSLFDSVSGTAINLGGRVGAGGTPVQLHGSHQRISSLAKEARDVQPGLIKDSTMMRPAISDSGRALATEAHPNPSSIPEEECIRDNDIEKVDSVPDIMTTSIYHQKNGKVASEVAGHMNGSSGTDKVAAASSTGEATIVDVGGASDGTMLKCLEEPSFEFEASHEATTTAKKQPADQSTSASSKKPPCPYRVLEDPFEAVPPKRSNPPNYRVLEDPMTTAMYDPSTSSEAATAAATTASSSTTTTAPAMGSSRPAASEVLEGAREKFDKFWGSGTSSSSSSKKAPSSSTTEPPSNEP